MTANAEVVLQDCSADAGMVKTAVVTRTVLAAHPVETAEKTAGAMMMVVVAAAADIEAADVVVAIDCSITRSNV